MDSQRYEKFPSATIAAVPPTNMFPSGWMRVAMTEGVNDEVVHNDILEIKNRLADVGEVVGHTLGVLCQRQIFRSY